MSTQKLGASGSADGGSWWLRRPETVGEWLAATVAVVVTSLLVGVALGWPRGGVSAGILFGGIGLVLTVDRLWRHLDHPA
ncbi:MAG: hypothetical protein U9O06_00065 [Euryarchaeota archaeon]|nr:hypothetical protein [Euryarchaeota archaeon]